MSFLSLTDLRQRVIRRLRQVQGANTQLYSEQVIDDMLLEAYDMCRSSRWWDHLMSWEVRELTGTNGLITAPLIGARQRYRDVRYVVVGTTSTALPVLSVGVNPYRLSGTYPRYIEPLSVSDDPNGTLLFRVWPLTASAPAAVPLRIQLRKDPPNVFTDPATIVPFDSICLINRASALYAADDNANPTQVESLDSVFKERLTQLQMQHDSAPIVLDSRFSSLNVDQWFEGP